MIVFPFLFQACLEAFTLRGVLLIYAGFILNFTIVGLAVKAMEERPIVEVDTTEVQTEDIKELENAPKLPDEDQKLKITEDPKIPKVESHSDIKEPIKTLPVQESITTAEDMKQTKLQTCFRFCRPFLGIKFVSISLYYFCYIYGVYGFLFNIPPYLVELGLSQPQIASALSISGALDFISRFGIGFIGRWPRINIYVLIAVNTALTGCFDVLVPLMLTSGSAYAVMVGNLAFVGLFAGGLLGLINQLIVDAVGMEKAGTGAGIFGAIFGITVLVYSQVYGRSTTVTILNLS